MSHYLTRYEEENQSIVPGSPQPTHHKGSGIHLCSKRVVGCHDYGNNLERWMVDEPKNQTNHLGIPPSIDGHLYNSRSGSQRMVGTYHLASMAWWLVTNWRDVDESPYDSR